MDDVQNDEEATGKLRAALDAAAAEQQADLYLYNGPIEDKGFMQLLQAASEGPSAAKAILFITTFGGDAGAAYRIARFMQRTYKEFVLFPTGVCASAGTLLAIGANKLLLSPLSELGPLDVQLSKPNEIGERKSGLVTKAAMVRLQEQAFEFWEHFIFEIKDRSLGQISFEKCAEIGSNVCARVFAEMYKQIDPEILGQDDRYLQVATEYGTRLAAKGKNVSNRSIKKLVEGYPSHDFVIDHEEVSDLFNSVDMASITLAKAVLALGESAIVTRTGRRGVKVEKLAAAGNAVAGAQAPEGGDGEAGGQDEEAA